MFKFQFTFLITIVLLTISCRQSRQIKSVNNSILIDNNYKVGDCFEFKEKINDFGVIFLEQRVNPDGIEFNLFPVKLNTTKKGLDKFKYGQVYITSFKDFEKASGKTEGFMVYFFIQQKNSEIINKYFNHIGNITIKEIYQYKTGGTTADNMEEFRLQLNKWDYNFGRDGRLISVQEIVP